MNSLYTYTTKCCALTTIVVLLISYSFKSGATATDTVLESGKCYSS